eukprot:15152126-Heterocapsa_arctica.AAC.1
MRGAPCIAQSPKSDHSEKGRFKSQNFLSTQQESSEHCHNLLAVRMQLPVGNPLLKNPKGSSCVAAHQFAI